MDLKVDLKTVITVKGMTCEHCAKRVRGALAAIPGVVSAEVNLKEKTAAVTHGEAVAAKDLVAAVSEAGYKASVRKA